MATAAVDSSYAGSVEVEEVRAIMRSLQDLYVEGPRAALISRDGYHRPYTRGGGYNRASHLKLLTDAPQTGRQEERPQHPLSTREVKVSTATFGGDINNASKRKGKECYMEVEVPINPTTRGIVLTDWPYNRGSTPPAFHPLPLYTPVDTRDENAKIKEPDGRVMGRNYFSNHSRSMVTAGGFLNGLPRAGEDFRPHRVCGKGVISAAKAEEAAKKVKAIEAVLSRDDSSAKMMLDTVKKSKIKELPIEDMIAERVVILHGGGEWGQALEYIPLQLVAAPDLLELDLSSNKLRRISDAICNMPNLTRMNLDSNVLESLPQGLDALKSLTWLSCCNNLIDRVPLAFGRLPAIQTADFSNNKIPLLLEHVVCLSSLITLSFVGNVLTSQMPCYPGAPPDEVLKMAKLDQLASITSLNLESNKLTHVPFGLSALTNLKFLRLGRNQIASRGAGGTSCPALDSADAFKELKHLAPKLLFLDLHQNRIDEVHEDICHLSRLTHLDFSSNQISRIPEAVTSLAALSLFKIDRNPLLSIPTSMASMPWLREFSCKDCVLGRVGGVVDPVPGGMTGKWRRQHGPVDGRVLQQLEEFVALDLDVLGQYKKATCYKDFDTHAGVTAKQFVPNDNIYRRDTKSQKSTGPPGSAGNHPRTPGSRHASRHGARRVLAALDEVDEFAHELEEQAARGRKELQDGKRRYTQRRASRMLSEAPQQSPNAQPLHALSSPPHDTLTSPDRMVATGIVVTSPGGSKSPENSMARMATHILEARPHVRNYLFEHQLENRMSLLQDGWNQPVQVFTCPNNNKGVKASAGTGGVATDTRRALSSDSSAASSAGAVNARGVGALNKGGWSASAAEGAVHPQRNAVTAASAANDTFRHAVATTSSTSDTRRASIAGYQDKSKPFEYYRNAATTPYVTVNGLMSL